VQGRERYVAFLRSRRRLLAFCMRAGDEVSGLRKGDRNILLPVEQLAEVLKVSKMTISNSRDWAKADGFLREVKEACHAKKQATEFRFNVQRVEMLREAAERGTQLSYDETE
jgi:hypothetical protein